MTRLLAWWQHLTTIDRVYIIGIPAAVVIMQVPWLTAWMPDDLKADLRQTAYWLLWLAVSTVVAWLRNLLKSPAQPITKDSDTPAPTKAP